MKIGSMNLRNIEERIANGFIHGELADLAEGEFAMCIPNSTNDHDDFMCAHWRSEIKDTIHKKLEANGYATVHYVVYRINHFGSALLPKGQKDTLE